MLFRFSARLSDAGEARAARVKTGRAIGHSIIQRGAGTGPGLTHTHTHTSLQSGDYELISSTS